MKKGADMCKYLQHLFYKHQIRETCWILSKKYYEKWSHL